MKKYQRPNPYNRFLPYASDIENDAERYFQEIKQNFKQCLKPKIDLINVNKLVINLQKFISLYGFQFTLEDHVWLIKLLYGLLTSENVDPVSLDKYTKVFINLCKKKYLLSGTGLILDWKPLYKLVYKYEDSSEVTCGLIKVQPGLIVSLRSVVKYARPFFSHESTKEILDEFRPLLCPFDQSMLQGIVYTGCNFTTIPDHKYDEYNSKVIAI